MEFALHFESRTVTWRTPHKHRSIRTAEFIAETFRRPRPVQWREAVLGNTAIHNQEGYRLLGSNTNFFRVQRGKNKQFCVVVLVILRSHASRNPREPQHAHPRSVQEWFGQHTPFQRVPKHACKYYGDAKYSTSHDLRNHVPYCIHNERPDWGTVSSINKQMSLLHFKQVGEECITISILLLMFCLHMEVELQSWQWDDAP